MINLFDLSTASILAIVLSIVIPGISALAERIGIPQQFSGIVTAIIAAANGFITEWAQSSNANTYDWRTALGLALGSLAVAGISHFVITSGHIEAKLAGRAPSVAGEHERRAA